MTLNPPCLQLRPYSPEHLLALLEGEEAFHRSFGIRAAARLRDFFPSGEVSAHWLEQLREARAADPWTLGFAVIPPAVGQVIGNAGFKGPPVDGTAEVAYAIVPAWQGKGCATAALGKLIAFAAVDGRVRQLRAHTLPENNASTRVLAKNGFAKTGEVIDPDDGLVWRWERTKEATQKQCQ